MNPLTGTFITEDWERICLALEYYHDSCYHELTTQNATDTQWSDCMRYKSLQADIQYFILPHESPNDDVQPIQDQT